LAVEMSSIVGLLCRNTTEMICGARYHHFSVKLEMLLKKLSTHVELVFFRDSFIPKQKRETWSKRQEKKEQDFLNVLEYVEQYDNSVSSILEAFPKCSWYMKSMMTIIDEICSGFGNIHHSLVSA
jgi:hypothetical protein